jgi:hypothetical protein
MTSTFKTTLIDPLHFVAAFFLVKVQLPKLLREYADRVHCLLPSHQLCTLLTSHNPVAIWPSWFPIFTPITCLPAPSFPLPLFSFLAHPSQQCWTHPHLVNGSSLLADLKGRSEIRTRIKNPSYDTFQIHIHNLPIPPPTFASAFMVF